MPTPEGPGMPENDYVTGNQLGIINIKLTLFNASCQQLLKYDQYTRFRVKNALPGIDWQIFLTSVSNSLYNLLVILKTFILTNLQVSGTVGQYFRYKARSIA